MTRTPPELLQGTVDILILRALAWQSMHGYAVSRWLDTRSGGVLSVEGAALYQGLHRLERQKLIASEWGLSENNRRARYYTITRAGRALLRAEASIWLEYAHAVTRVLRAEPSLA